MRTVWAIAGFGTLGLLMSLGACGTPGLGDGERSFADCRSLDCQEAALVAQWEHDPEGAAARVLGVADPVVQLALGERLAHALPGRLGPLCRQLPPGSAAARCAATDSRPHLGRRAPGAGSPGVAAPTPEGLALSLPPAPALRGGVADPALCATAPSRDACLQRRAGGAVRQGALADAVAICHVAGDGLAADECVFRTAERLLQRPAGQIPLDAAQRLCRQAGDLDENCLGHVVLAVSAAAPPADGAAAQAWAPVLQLRDRLVSPWADHPTVAAGLVDLFWAEVARASVARAAAPSGAALALLPDGARPHLRAALAAAVVEDAGPDAPLAAVLATLAAVEAGEALVRQRPAQPAPRRPLARPPARPDARRIHHLGEEWRWTVDDPARDRLLCVVEAAGRHGPDRAGLLAAAAAEGDPLVAAAVARFRPPG